MITPKQAKILQILGRYKFLTRSQCARLEIEKYNSNYTKYCQPLIDAKLIGLIDAKPYNLGHIYYLKEKGAKITASHFQSDLSNLNYVKTPPSLSPQILHHRKYSIDCQIELFQTCASENIEIDFYERDIETLGSVKKNKTLERKTRVPIHNNQYLEPDAIFRINTDKGQKLYCLELENETYTKKSFAKIEKHISALNLKSPSKKYGHKKAHRVLMIYKDKGVMNGVIEKMKQQLSGIEKWFLFKAYEDVITPISLQKSAFTFDQQKDFLANWKTIQNTVVYMY